MPCRSGISLCQGRDGDLNIAASLICMGNNLTRRMASRKFEGGKFVKVEVGFSDKIESVEISGDFFLVPEQALGQIEAGLIGQQINADFQSLIFTTLESANAQMLGCTPSQLSQLIKEAIGVYE